MSAEYFVQLDIEEDVLGIVRRSPWTRWRAFAFSGVWFVVPFFFFFPLLILGLFGLIIFLIFAGTGAYSLLRTWIAWKHTMLLITDRRIIDIDQQSIFKKDITEIDICNVKDAIFEIKGFWNKRLGLGDIIIHTKRSEDFDIEMSGVKNPEVVVNLVNDVQCYIKQEDAGSHKVSPAHDSIKHISIYEAGTGKE
ncbi:PH domain-containing protein [Patescibacteria group bacterium]|nr:PH domain-containing protein [Patescibacteria group bacterium]